MKTEDINIDGILSSIEKFKKYISSCEDHKKLYKAVISLIKTPCGKQKLYEKFICNTGYDGGLNYPISTVSEMDSFMNFFYMLSYNLLDDGCLYLINIDNGFPIFNVTIPAVGDKPEKKLSAEIDNDKWFFTDTEIYSEKDVLKLIDNMNEKFYKHMGYDIPNEYEVSGRYVGLDEFIKIFKAMSECDHKTDIDVKKIVPGKWKKFSVKRQFTNSK